MADDNDGIYVKFGAKLDELEAGMKAAKDTVQNGVSGMKSHLESLNAGFGMITAGFAAFTAAVAGGSALKSFVSDAVNATSEAVALGKQLGINATEASYFLSAANNLGISQETLSNMSSKVTMQLNKNEDAFKKLGVATRDQDGNFRNTKDIMMETNAKLREFGEGTDRNIEGMKIYGRAWGDVSGAVNKFEGETKKSREEAELMGEVVGKELVQQMKDYKEANIQASQTMENISVTIGREMIPRLTEMANWFASIGPDAIEATRAAMQGYLTIQDSIIDSIKAVWSALSTSVGAIVGIFTDAFGSGGKTITAMEFFKNVIRIVQVAFIGFRVGVEEVCAVIVSSIENVIIILKGMAAVAVAALNLDWDGIKSAVSETGDKMVANFDATVNKMTAIAKKGNEDISNALMGEVGAAKKVTPLESTKPSKDAPRSAGGETKEGKAKDERMKLWESELLEQKTKYMLENDMREQTLEADKAFWDKKLASLSNGDAKINEVKKKSAEINFAIQKKSAAENKALSEEEIAFKEKMGLAAIDTERQFSEQLSAMGLQTKEQELQSEIEFENRKFAIQEKAILDRIELLKKDPTRSVVERQKLNDQLVEMEQKHSDEVRKIQSKSTLEGTKNFTDMFGSIRQSFEGAIAGMVSGAMTLRQGLASLWQGILGAFSQFIAKKVTMWIFGENAQTAATVGGNVIRVASSWWAAGQSVMATAWAAIKNIASAAWEAAAAVYKSISMIPIVGPFLAPAAAVAATGVVLGFAGRIASAEGGFDIPSGLNPITQLHEKEMVLPAAQADAVRNMAENGGTGGGMNVTIHAVDAASVKKLFMENGSALFASLKNQNRNFATR